ncbi:hypothetical protein SERLA73DRAFT_74158 [Serpula lacrymans var. lacrymans S7.3]|uniref:Uncharacterized protein n=1 Tax=Serpula lacrymans var. lacrymans (strain S7.3) TaxID=936435 RepID=F8Q0S9_SERL3|nr:hypothetical protein SERLA73DRAFT_74158 [Serpula lacrymans var. lacrymans S7.3]
MSVLDNSVLPPDTSGSHGQAPSESDFVLPFANTSSAQVASVNAGQADALPPLPVPDNSALPPSTPGSCGQAPSESDFVLPSANTSSAQVANVNAGQAGALPPPVSLPPSHVPSKRPQGEQENEDRPARKVRIIYRDSSSVQVTPQREATPSPLVPLLTPTPVPQAQTATTSSSQTVIQLTRPISQVSTLFISILED